MAINTTDYNICQGLLIENLIKVCKWSTAYGIWIACGSALLEKIINKQTEATVSLFSRVPSKDDLGSKEFLILTLETTA